jgi:hypothetical protein
MPDLGSIASSAFQGYFLKRRRKLASVFILAKDPGGATLSSTRELNRKFYNSSLLTLKLQFFPETLTDDGGGVTWANIDVPFAPVPIYQWTGGGERTVSFTAVLYREVYRENTDLSPMKESKYNVDINEHIKVLRSMKTGRYDTSSSNQPLQAPPLLLLYFPKTHLRILPKQGADILPCVMTNCSIGYKAWFEDGTPRLASVELTFTEISQYSGTVLWLGREKFTNR